MTKEEKKRISQIFTELDKDNDGKLSYEELVESFERSGRTRKRSENLVNQILQELHLSANEGVEYSHFLVTC